MTRIYLTALILTLAIFVYAQDGILKIPVPLGDYGLAQGVGTVTIAGDSVYYTRKLVDTLFMYINGMNKSFPFNLNEENIRFYSAKAFNDGRVYLRTSSGLYHFWDSLCTPIEFPDSTTLYGLYPTFTESSIFITSESALNIYDGTTWTTYLVDNPPLNFRGSRVLPQSDSVAWIYKNAGGLYRLKNNEVSLYDSIGRGSMCLDHLNRIWTNGDFEGKQSIGLYEEGMFTPISQFYPDYDLSIPSGKLYSNRRGMMIIEDYSDIIQIREDSLHFLKVAGYNIAELHDNFLWSYDGDTIYRQDLRYRNTLEAVHDGRFHFYNYKKLDINNISAGYNTWGELHPSTWSAALVEEVTWPRDSDWVINHNRGLIMGALDGNDSLHLNNEQRYQERYSYQPGPLDTIDGLTNPDIALKYDKIFTVKREEIEEFLYMFQMGFVNDSSYTIPRNILEWPAQGSGNISRNLAPFVDVDGDDIYDIFHGDYPKMKGDEMFWYVYNDNFPEYRKCSSRAFGVEVHCSVYAYAQNESLPDSLDVLNNCQFVEYEIFNRSDTTYYDTYLGIFDQGSLPSYLNQFNNSNVYSGCNVDLNATYFYNYPLYDDSTEILNRIISWLTFLEGPMADPDDGIDNDHDFETDEEGETINMSSFMPSSCCPPVGQTCHLFADTGVYNMLRGYRYNSEPYYYFDDFHYSEDTTSGVICKYVFPDLSNPEGWGQDGISMSSWTDSEYSWGLDNRITWTGLGPFTFYPGQKVSMKFVFGATLNDQLNLEGSNFENDIRTIRELYFNDLIENPEEYVPNDTLIDTEIDINIFPNPVIGDYIRVNLLNETQELVSYELFDPQGRKLKEGILKYEYRNLISVKDMKAGLYFFHFYNTQLSITKQLIRIE